MIKTIFILLFCVSALASSDELILDGVPLFDVNNSTEREIIINTDLDTGDLIHPDVINLKFEALILSVEDI